MDENLLRRTAATLEEIRQNGLFKVERMITSPQGAEIQVNGRTVVNFCANNYLGLSSHPRLVAAAHEGIDRYGSGMSSVRFICGTQDQHRRLEGELAISTASLSELHFGVLVATDSVVRAERLRRLSDLQRTFDPLPIDNDVATSYGRLAAAVVTAGRQPRSRTMDLLIAATAHAHAARLYTRNAGDLVGIEDLLEIVAV